MAGKSDTGRPHFFELGALEHEGVLWRFTLSNAHCDILLNYGSEESARRARMLIFEALKDVAPPGAGTGTRSPRRRIPVLLKKAVSRFRGQRR